MNKQGPIKGSELPGKLTLVPGAVYGGNVGNVAGSGTGTTRVPVADLDYAVIRVTALDGFTRNHSGNPITGYDLGGVDPVFSNVVAYLYPGAATDDNDLVWECPVPQDMDLLDPQITVILHFLIPSPPYTPAVLPGSLPVGCTDSILWYNGTAWQAALPVFDASGDLVSSGGAIVVVDC